MKDYYEILGVTKSATDAELKSAYRKQALQWHPDRNKTPEANERFKEINKAYEVLSNSQKRQQYDQLGHDAYERGGAGSASGWPGGAGQGPFTYTYSSSGENPFGADVDPFEIFEQFFGFRSPFGGSGRQRRSIYQITVTFDEAVKGVEKEVKIEGKNKKIKIPAGVDDGNRIRFSDFDLQINVLPHPQFKREGQDVYMEVKIQYPLAVLGGTLEVPTLDGQLKIKVRPGTESGTAVRLRGQGIVYPNTKQHGDEYIILKVNIPEHVSGKAKKLLEELDKELS